MKKPTTLTALKASLEARVLNLEDVCTQLVEQGELLREQVAEMNLRVRFVMDHFKFAKSSPASQLTDANGQPLKPETYTLFDIFVMRREAYTEQLMLEIETVRTQIEHQQQAAREQHGQSASHTSQGHTSADAAAHAADAPASGPGEPATAAAPGPRRLHSVN